MKIGDKVICTKDDDKLNLLNNKGTVIFVGKKWGKPYIKIRFEKSIYRDEDGFHEYSLFENHLNKIV